MQMGIVLDPTVSRAAVVSDPGPDFGDVRGKTVGFRVDTLWRSWDWVVGVWAATFEKAGAEVIYWRTHQARTGAEGARIAAEEAEFMKRADMVISGLGNCGSCTGWSIRDGIVAREAGLPAMVVMTAPFETLSESIAQRAGHPGLRRFILPHPLNELKQEEVERIASQLVDEMLSAVGVKAPAEA